MAQPDVPPIPPPPLTPGTAMPYWSVMVPTYKPRPEQLEAALRSVLAQDPGPTEMQIEVVDDASPNLDVGEVVQRVGGGRVSFFRNPQNLGIGGNWNACVARARGEWVHLLHQDDQVLDGFYARLRRAGTVPDAGAAFCRCACVDVAGRRVAEQPVFRPEAGVAASLLDDLGAWPVIMTPAIVVRRSAYEAVGGFHPRLLYTLDWEMWVRLAVRYAVWYEPDVLALYRVHGESFSFELYEDAEDLRDVGRALEVFKDYLPPDQCARLRARTREKAVRTALRQARRQARAGQVEAALAQAREALGWADTFRDRRRLWTTILRLRLRQWLGCRSLDPRP